MRATSDASSMSRGISVLGRRFLPGGVSQRWSLTAHYDARRSRRTYLRIKAIMLIIVSRAARASGGPARPPFRVVVTACATITGIALPWTHAIHSLRTRAGGPPRPRGKTGTAEEGGCSGEEGRSNERTQKHTLAGLTRRHPLPSAARASFRLGVIRSPAERTHQIGSPRSAGFRNDAVARRRDLITI